MTELTTLAPQDGPPEGEGYDLQAVYAEQNKPFWFRWADRWWVLPHLRMLDFEKQIAVESFDYDTLTGGDEDVDLEQAKGRLNDLFDLIMGEEQAKDWRAVDRPFQFIFDLLGRWSAHSGAKPGEDSASTDSSKSTERPLKRTSTGGTGSGSRRRSPAKAATPARQDKATPAKRASAAAVKNAIQRENS